MKYPKDPTTGRNFDGHFDEVMPCGCVVFYRGGRVLCEHHGSENARRLEQELAEENELHLRRECGNTFAVCPRQACACAQSMEAA